MGSSRRSTLGLGGEGRCEGHALWLPAPELGGQPVSEGR